MSSKREFFECPNCGADVRVGAKVCRACGSDASTGWKSSEEIDYQSIDIPDGYGPEDEESDEVARDFAMIGKDLTRALALILALVFAAWALGLL